MCFFGGGGVGPQSSADLANTGNKPVKQQVVNKAVQNQQTADKNTMRRADSYGSQKAATSASTSNTTAKTSNATAVQSGMKTMNALNDYNKTNKKTILGS
jgi:hypothetical protein